LVVLGIVALLLAIAVPWLGQARGKGWSAVSLANAREIGLAVQMYADVSKDLPPVFFAPITGHYPETPPQRVVTVGGPARGYWFDHEWEFPVAIDPPLPAATLQSPGLVRPREPGADSIRYNGLPDFRLTQSLYATPAFWDRYTQAGPSQWAAQTLGSIRFPASKGLLFQHHKRGPNGRQQIPQYVGVRGAITWADLSVTETDHTTLLPGEPNFWDHWRLRPPTFLEDGWAVRATKDGVWGRDR